MSEQLSRLAADIGDSWAQTHEVKLREIRGITQPVPSQNIAQFVATRDAETEANSVIVTDAEILVERGLQLLRRIQKVEKAFQDRVEIANCCRSDDGSLLESSTFLTFCSIQDAAGSLGTALTDSGPISQIAFPESLLDGLQGSLLITGAPGYGKTTFCKANVLHDLAALATGHASSIPIYTALHQLAQGPLGSFEESFIRSRELRDYLVEAQQQNSKRRLRLYLDGLDEVPSLQRQQELVELAQSAMRHYRNLQIIITGRDYVGGPWLNWLPRVFLAQFSGGQIRLLVSKWLENDEKEIEKFFTHLRSVPAVEPLMAVPLLATLVLAVFRKTRGRLPENKIKLYDMFVELLAGGWDAAKNLNRDSQFGSGTKITVLTRLAGKLHQGRVRECSEIDIGTAIRDVLPGLSEMRQQLIGEFLQDGILSRTATKFTFSHHSFQESLAARDLAGQEHTAKAILLAYLRGDDWWAESIKFYLGRSSNPRPMAAWIKDGVSAIWEETEEDAEDDMPKERGAELIQSLKQFFPGFDDSYGTT